MDPNRLSWSIEPGSTSLDIMYDGKKVMSLFIGEAMEIAGRKVIMEHVDEINRTPWITGWHKLEE